MLHQTRELDGAVAVRAVVGGLVGVLLDGGGADRAALRHLEASRPAFAAREHGADHLRDDVSGPLHDHVVALADVLEPHLLLVVQRGDAHLRAADDHRLQHRERCEHAGAAHRHLDLPQPRHRLFRRKLVRRRPARFAAHRAQLALEREVVHLDHHAVDRVLEVGAPLHPRLAEVGHLVDCLKAHGVGAGGKTSLGEPSQRLPVRVGRLAVLGPADLVADHVKAAARGHRRVELPQRARGGIARVHVELLAGCGALRIEPLELRARHVDLAPHLEGGGRARYLECERDRADGAQVLCDVLAPRSVAARRSPHKAAALVHQRDRQPVNLGLADHCEPLPFEQPGDTGVPGAQILGIEHVAEREHRQPVLDGPERLHGLARDTLGGGVRREEPWEVFLQADQLAEEAVVFGVVDLRLMHDIIQAIVVANLRSQLLDALAGALVVALLVGRRHRSRKYTV